MADKLNMPNIGTPMVTPDGRLTKEWANFLQQLLLKLNSLL